MDPMTIMALISGGLQLASGALSTSATLAGMRAMKRQARLQTASLAPAADLASVKSGWLQSRVEDNLDATLGRQAAFFAGGNFDMATGSPAVLAAQSEALATQDAAAAAAQGARERADAWGQIAGVWSKQNEARVAGAYNIASTVLSTATKLAGLGMKAGGFDPSGSAMTAAASAGPLDINPLSYSGLGVGSLGGLY